MSIGRIYHDDFWNLLEKVEKAETPLLVSDLGEEKDVLEAVYILKTLGHPIRLEKWADGHQRIIPAAKKFNYEITLSSLDWLALQAHFQAFDRYRHKQIDSRLHSVILALAEKMPTFPIFNMPGNAMPRRQQLDIHDNAEEALVHDLELHIANKVSLKVQLASGEELLVLPFKTYFLEGGKCLVAQDVIGGAMRFIPLRELHQYQISNEEKIQVSPVVHNGLEIDEYVDAICAISGQKTRLIAKMLAPEKINFASTAGMLVNPYMTSSNDGHLIWAATVNVGPDLLQWLMVHKEWMTIIDPPDFRDIFEEFCRKNQNKVPNAA